MYNSPSVNASLIRSHYVPEGHFFEMSTCNGKFNPRIVQSGSCRGAASQFGPILLQLRDLCPCLHFVMCARNVLGEEEDHGA